MAKRVIPVNAGDIVQIWAVDEQIDPNRYTVSEIIGKRVRLVNEHEKRITVHVTRIAHKSKVNDKTERKTMTEKSKTTNQAEETNVATQETVKSEKVKLDFDHLNATGELWSKTIDFNHSQKAIAHVWIANDGKTYRPFNTYDGSLGAKGKSGKTFILDDEKALEKKRRSLEKKGYTK